MRDIKGNYRKGLVHVGEFCLIHKCEKEIIVMSDDGEATTLFFVLFTFILFQDKLGVNYESCSHTTRYFLWIEANFRWRSKFKSPL